MEHREAHPPQLENPPAIANGPSTQPSPAEVPSTVDPASNAPRRLQRQQTFARQDPTELDAFAQWTWLSGRVEEAIDLYLDLAHIHPTFPHVHFKLGFLFLNTEEFRHAIRHFTVEIERTERTVGSQRSTEAPPSPAAEQPDNPGSAANKDQRAFLLTSYYGRSEAYRGADLLDEASRDRLYIQTCGGNSIENLVLMGDLLFRFGMFTRASGFLEQCARIDSNSVQYLILFAELCLAQRRFLHAERLFERIRRICETSSTPMLVVSHRALIGEACCALRQQKLSMAHDLLQRAINSLRDLKAKVPDESTRPRHQSSCTTSSSSRASGLFRELTVLEVQASVLWAGLYLMKANLQRALDILLVLVASHRSILQSCVSAAWILPGTKTSRGKMLDSSRFSRHNMLEMVRHLNELELRYGPNAAVAFHRANVFRALGKVEPYVQELTLVCQLDPEFLQTYHQYEQMGDFFETQSITWLPVDFLNELVESMQRKEYIPPSTSVFTSMACLDRADCSESLAKSFSEQALFVYLATRSRFVPLNKDGFAPVVSLDVLRRLTNKATTSINSFLSRANPAHGKILDDSLVDPTSGSMPSGSFIPSAQASSVSTSPQYLRSQVDLALARFPKHPMVHMIAGLSELECFNAARAKDCFSEAICLVDCYLKDSVAMLALLPASAALLSANDLTTCCVWLWQQQVLEHIKFYSLVWRSMSNRLQSAMDDAVDDLNAAAALHFDAGNVLLCLQRAIIMLLNGRLKSAHRILSQLDETRQTLSRFLLGSFEPPSLHDCLSNVGMLTFRLIPIECHGQLSARCVGEPGLTPQGSMLSAGSSAMAASPNGVSIDFATKLTNSLLVAQQRSGVRGNSISVRRTSSISSPTNNASLSRRNSSLAKMSRTNSVVAAAQCDTLDKFFEYALFQFATTAHLGSCLAMFKAILAVHQDYMPPTNLASHALAQCLPDQDEQVMEERLYIMFLKLKKRSQWLEARLHWRFEALCDANLAHAYFPADLEILWHRALLFRNQRNLVAAKQDISLCIDMMANNPAVMTVDRSNPGRDKPVFVDDKSSALWSQLFLERGLIEVSLGNWESASQDLNLVIVHASSHTHQTQDQNQELLKKAYEARSAAYIRVKKYKSAINDLQKLVALLMPNGTSSSSGGGGGASAGTGSPSKSKRKLDGSTKDLGGAFGGLFNSTKSAAPPADAEPMTGQSLHDKAQTRHEVVLNCIQIGNLYCQIALDEEKKRAQEALKKPGGGGGGDAFSISARQPFCTEMVAELETISDVHLISLANSWYDKALKAWPNHFFVLYFRARLAAMSGKAKPAIQYISDCLQECKMFLPGLFLRGSLYIRQGLMDLALFDLIRIRKLAPSYPRVLVNIGYCYYLQQHFDKAVQVLSESLEYAPCDSQALYLRGCALQELSCLERAIEDFSACISLANDSPPTTTTITTTTSTATAAVAPTATPASIPSDASASSSSSSASSAPPARAVYQRAVCNLVLQNYSSAVDDLRQVLGWHPEFLEGLQVMAYACFWLGRYDEAAGYFTRALSVMGPMDQDPKVFCYRALAHYYAKNENAAMVDIELAIRKDPKDMVHLLLKARFLVDRGQFDPALQCLLRATPYSWSLDLLPSSIFEDGAKPESLYNLEHGDRVLDPTAMRAASLVDFVVDGSSQPDANKKQHECVDLFAARKRNRHKMLLKYLPTTNANRSTPVRRRVVLPVDPADDNPTVHAQANPDTSDLVSPPKVVQPEEDPAWQRRQEIRYRLIRALRKITFGNRLVKSIETQSASLLSTTNQAFVRKVQHLVQSKSRIRWPKGTPTTSILVWAFNTLGIFYLQKRKLNEALRAFTVGIQTDPKQPRMLFNRGMVYLFMDLFGPSLACFQEAIVASPGCVAAHNNLGVALYNLKKYDEAQQAFSTGLHYASDDEATQKALLCFNLGVTFQVLDKQSAAMEFYQQAIQLDPTRAEFLNNRSMMYHQQLKFTMALSDYDKALRLHELAEQKLQQTPSKDAQHPSPLTLLNLSGPPPPLDSANGEGTSAEGKCFELRMNRAQLFISMGHCTAAINDLQVAIEALQTAKETVEAAKNATCLTKLSVLGRKSSRHISLLNQQKLTEVTEMESAQQMLRFCEKWRLALRAALNDFLYALNAFPCFTACHVNLLQLEQQQQQQQQHGEATPLEPILDKCFIDGELLIAYCECPPVTLTPFSSTTRALLASSMAASDAGSPTSPKKQSEFHALLVQALVLCLQEQYEPARTALLRAHYLTRLDSHEEYLIVFWRSQLHYSSGDTEQAIALLREFLESRRTRGEFLAVQLVLRQAQESAIAEESIDEPSGAASAGNEVFSSGNESLSVSDAWVKQRRVIRADGYVYLGCLYLVQDQRKQAMESFLSALAIRPDHAFAIMNALRLSVAEQRYEAALDFIIKLFDVTKRMNVPRDNPTLPSAEVKRFGHSTTPSTKTSDSTSNTSNTNNNSEDPEVPGLLNLNRSLRAQLGHVASAISNDQVVSDLFAQIHQLLKEYRSLLTAQVHSHYPEIFRKQGRLVRLTEKLDSHLQQINGKGKSFARSSTNGSARDNGGVRGVGGTKATTKAASLLGFSTNSLVNGTTRQLQLDDLNRIAQECTKAILSNPQSFQSDAIFHHHKQQFNDLYDQLCTELHRVLPVRSQLSARSLSGLSQRSLQLAEDLHKVDESRHSELFETRDAVVNLDASSPSIVRGHQPLRPANFLRRKPSGRMQIRPKNDAT